MANYFDDDTDLQQLLMRRRMEADQNNRQSLGMDAQVSKPPPPDPFPKEEPKKSLWSSILSPVMKVGGVAATALGQPEIGIPLSIGGSALGGASGGGGMVGALKGGVKSGLGQATGGMFDWLNGPAGGGPIDLTSAGLTVPGDRADAIDMGGMFNTTGGTSAGGGYTIPASPKGLFGGS